jgi:anti-sigma-K factor RskA
MSEEHTHALSEEEEIEALLPWYVAGRLEARERSRVERYVETHPEIRAHLALVREERDSAIAGNEAVPVPGTQALERLRRSIAAAQLPRRSPSLFNRVSQRLSEWIAGFAPPQLAYAAGLAALVVALQAAVIGALVLERVRTPSYQTAGGEESTRGGTELLVTFSETATVGEIDTLLKRLDAIVIDGPKAGLYRVQLRGAGDDTQKAAIEALLQSGLVTLVLPGR